MKVETLRFTADVELTASEPPNKPSHVRIRAPDMFATEVDSE